MKNANRVSWSPLFHFFFLLVSFKIFLVHVVIAQNTTIPSASPAPVAVNVGVVLDFDKQLGKIGLSCINMVLFDFYATHASYRTRLVLNPKDSKMDVVAAAATGSCFFFFL
ncbi:hypothetical protein PTKIN_Ptkin06aG0091500 [Pterospermum kingtungense]